MHNTAHSPGQPESPPEINFEDVPELRLALQEVEVPFDDLGVDLREYTHDSLAGVVTNISLERGDSSAAVDNSPQGVTITLGAISSHVRRHGYLNTFAGMNLEGYLPLKWRGEEVRVGIRYTIDQSYGITSANVFYDGLPGHNEDAMEAMLMPKLAHTFFKLYGCDVRVTFGREDEESRRYDFDGEELHKVK